MLRLFSVHLSAVLQELSVWVLCGLCFDGDSGLFLWLYFPCIVPFFHSSGNFQSLSAFLLQLTAPLSCTGRGLLVASSWSSPDMEDCHQTTSPSLLKQFVLLLIPHRDSSFPFAGVCPCRIIGKNDFSCFKVLLLYWPLKIQIQSKAYHMPKQRR